MNRTPTREGGEKSYYGDAGDADDYYIGLRENGSIIDC